jgi:hypothetical protein
MIVAFTAAVLALSTAASPLKVSGCDLLANPDKYNGKVVQFVGRRLPDIELLKFGPFGCSGHILISDNRKSFEDHRLPWQAMYEAKGGLMVPATSIEGKVRIEDVPASHGRAALTVVLIDEARIKPAGFRFFPSPKPSKQRK